MQNGGTNEKGFKCPVGLKNAFEMDAINNEFCFKEISTITITSNLEFRMHLSIDVDDPDETDLTRKMSNTSSNNTSVSATRSLSSLLLLKTVRTETSATC
ncbi:hypothetical protein AVEN_243290-1 [Araneus ventricosus]|uniref:Uncharacterized protein n=1 Tax=Araneus ventricosus TaxID=182803 RepID=A0A4Y2PZV2_ARAVE|nr:hypothetical protein AVEN_243290-1 [Araneus ventricosus]